MLPIRTAFLAAGAGHLRLVQLDLKREGGGSVLHITGWHADDTPFAIVSAPFQGDPLTRAREIAYDIIRLHHGQDYMPAPVQIKSLAATLRETLARATQAASALSQDATNAVSELEEVVAAGNAIVTDVKAATAEVQAALGLSTNGGPDGPLPGEVSPTSSGA